MLTPRVQRQARVLVWICRGGTAGLVRNRILTLLLRWCWYGAQRCSSYSTALDSGFHSLLTLLFYVSLGRHKSSLSATWTCSWFLTLAWVRSEAGAPGIRAETLRDTPVWRYTSALTSYRMNSGQTDELWPLTSRTLYAFSVEEFTRCSRKLAPHQQVSSLRSSPRVGNEILRFGALLVWISSILIHCTIHGPLAPPWIRAWLLCCRKLFSHTNSYLWGVVFLGGGGQGPLGPPPDPRLQSTMIMSMIMMNCWWSVMIIIIIIVLSSW